MSAIDNMLVGRIVEIKTVKNETIVGKLLFKGRDEILLETDKGTMLLFKVNLTYLRVLGDELAVSSIGEATRQ